MRPLFQGANVLPATRSSRVWTVRKRRTDPPVGQGPVSQIHHNMMYSYLAGISGKPFFSAGIMFEQSIRSVMEHHKFFTAAPEETVSTVARQMASRNLGAVLVVRNGLLAGIFTERDAVFRVIARGLDPATTPLRDVMTAQPMTLGPEKSFGHALLMMQENGFRHLPVIEDGRPIGIVSARNAMDPDLEEFVWEERRREYHSAGKMGSQAASCRTP
jgi:CBS domain-containing protein